MKSFFVFFLFLSVLNITVLSDEKIVVMLGDSTTLCDMNSPGKKLAELVQVQLMEAFKKNAVTFKVVNSGVGGSTAKEAIPRVTASVINQKPDFVTISFGLNDLGKSTPEEFRKSIETIIEMIQKDSKAQIMLITSTPFDNAHHAWKDKFAKDGGLDKNLDDKICKEMRTLATKYKLPICDLHQKFDTDFKKDPALISKVIFPDGVHLTDEGNVLASGYVVAEITNILKGKKMK